MSRSPKAAKCVLRESVNSGTSSAECAPKTQGLEPARSTFLRLLSTPSSLASRTLENEQLPVLCGPHWPLLGEASYVPHAPHPLKRVVNPPCYFQLSRDAHPMTAFNRFYQSRFEDPHRVAFCVFIGPLEHTFCLSFVFDIREACLNSNLSYNLLQLVLVGEFGPCWLSSLTNP